uniref:NR LBD domain-containing protein n=2 Tax=Meloidogyne enterolobii TaxID=390850 RepID=A0A6V7XL85_MELEN|nr:unnamed protein product [Meloidogyne enterolobii]
MGMNIQKLRNPQQSTISLWEIRSKIEQRLGELALVGKYPEKRNKIFASSEGTDFSFMQTIFFENEETKIIGNLLSLEESVEKIRNSPTQITDKNYDFSYKTLEEVINRKENSIFLCYEYLEEQNFLQSDYIEFVHKNGFFSLRPTTLIEDLILIIDMAKTMTFFYKLELTDIIYQITYISMPLVALANVWYSCNRKSKTVITSDGVPVVVTFSGEYYKGDFTLNKLLQKLFVTFLEPYTRVQMDNEEYVLIRSIIFSHFVTNGLSKEGQKFLLSESEKYCGILMRMLQKRYGQLRGATRYAELLHLVEFCFKCGNHLSIFLNYVDNVLDQGRFEKVMPAPLIDLCLRCKNVKLPEITGI